MPPFRFEVLNFGGKLGDGGYDDVIGILYRLVALILISRVIGILSWFVALIFILRLIPLLSLLVDGLWGVWRKHRDERLKYLCQLGVCGRISTSVPFF